MHPKSLHDFNDIPQIRQKLLEFYNSNKRDLEWRQSIKDEQLRAYRVWVSEIMLQQTRVETVKEYYKKWILKWPTISEFVQADLQQVHGLWSGLGYYSRATRLLEGTKMVMDKLKGVIPSPPEELSKIPGIGPYTAGAISSIAFGKAVPLVDGNVIRVITRMTALGGDVKSKLVNERIWKLAAILVDPERPGCFNQSLMELGATICTPTKPDCPNCPVRDHCTAFKEEQNPRKRKTDDIEDLCTLCPPMDVIHVTDFPNKVAKKEARKETVLVCICQVDEEYLLIQNPTKGLLANLWDFPVLPIEEGTKKGDLLSSVLKVQSSKSVGEVVHKFSHIHRTMQIEFIELKDKVDIHLESFNERPIRWVSKENFTDGTLGIPITLTKAWEQFQKFKKLQTKKATFFKKQKVN